MSNETSENLKKNLQRILAEWEEQAHKSILSSVGLTSLVLKNEVHTFLESIAAALSTTIEQTDEWKAQEAAKVLRFAKVHGGGRATEPLHYTLAEVILEFHILHWIIIDVLKEHASLSKVERKLIKGIIYQALSAAATRFAEVHQQIQERLALTLVHDLRTPINVAKMSAQIIERNPKDHNQALHFAKMIDRNMDRLDSMLRELLDVSRIRAGMGIAFEFEEFRLDELVKEVVQELKDTYGERFNVRAGEPTTGTWNRAGLRRVFENLIVNAFKYGSVDTPVTVTVAQNPTRAIITVHNVGNPIPIEEQPRLFEKYVRASTASSQTGWGLGLALVIGMVTAHRGTVRLVSSPESGTDFIVEIPKSSSSVVDNRKIVRRLPNFSY